MVNSKQDLTRTDCAIVAECAPDTLGTASVKRLEVALLGLRQQIDAINCNYGPIMYPSDSDDSCNTRERYSLEHLPQYLSSLTCQTNNLIGLVEELEGIANRSPFV